MKSKKLKSKEIALAVAGAVIVLFILDLTPLGGNTYYYSNWVKCGHRPLYTSYGPGFEAGVPNYANAAEFGIGKGLMPYYCTPREAELAGYSADSKKYEFPHLNSDERRESFNKAQAIQSRD